MKKKLDETTVINELREGSLHFRRPDEEVAAQPEAEQEQPAPAAVAATVAHEAYPSVRTVVRTVQRTLKRHPFEFYKDQLDALKQLSLTEQMAGGRGNMSEMVREAVDEYLAKRNGRRGEEE